ncbi:MAG: septum formation initiator family protein [Candidatus Doudnabacteria bacterium]|nr:septum formation initiator family protein [Candidatus Doudnabacteria bacterium]
MFTKKTLTARASLIFLALLLCVLADLKYRQYQNQAAIKKQVDELSQQAAALDKQNSQLSDLLGKINTSDFREQVARQQLNYKKQGEVVYGFSGDPGGSPAAGQSAPAQSDFRSWWSYFFAD